MDRKYLVALPTFKGAKGFDHKTILVMAVDIYEAAQKARHLRPHNHIGEIKQVSY